jgi:hypothetical protein
MIINLELKLLKNLKRNSDQINKLKKHQVISKNERKKENFLNGKRNKKKNKNLLGQLKT